MRKVFVVDTSLLLHDPASILSFEDNIVVVPFPVLEELDSHKNHGENGTAAYARQAIRLLDDFRKKGLLHRGIETPNGGIFLVDNEGYIPSGVSLKTNTTDNFILSVALKWNRHTEWLQRHKAKKRDVVADFLQRFPFNDVCVITKDINLRVKAAALGIGSEDYLRDRAVEDEHRLYSGIARISIDDDVLREFGYAFFKESERVVPRSEIEKMVSLPQQLLPNQCCIFKGNEERCFLAIYKDGGGIEAPYFNRVDQPKNSRSRGIEPRNPQQALALALLMDRDIRIVTLSGIAGSGKTLMALLAGLRQLDKAYEQILVYRSSVEIGEPLGFLKGGLKQKFAPWIRPISDIFELLDQGNEQELFETRDTKKPLFKIDDLIGRGKIEIEPINHVRGRSFHRKFVVVDETQNFKPGDIKKVITRVGKGTKIVLTGDIAQIDNLYLDMLTNGLSHVSERFKGQRMFGHIALEKSERSELAELAAKLL